MRHCFKAKRKKSLYLTYIYLIPRQLLSKKVKKIPPPFPEEELGEDFHPLSLTLPEGERTCNLYLDLFDFHYFLKSNHNKKAPFGAFSLY